MLWRLRRRFAAWNELTYWSLDLETTGTRPATDRILSVGMVPVADAAIRWGGHSYTLVRSDAGAAGDVEALGIHQILPGEADDAPPLGAVLDDVAERLDGAVLVVHHAPLDVEFLRRSFDALGRRWPRPPVIDTVQLLARLENRMHRLEPYPRPLPRGLAAARERLGLPRHREHHALADALATAELFLALRARLDARRLGHLL